MNLFELSVKIGVKAQEFLDGINSAKKNFGDFTSWTIAKGQLIADGIKQGANALFDFGKQSLESYAEYEQLIGGVETLFEDLSWDVEQNAAKAFETAGLSANQYMETAMSFAASLNQSLTETEGSIARSAELTDQAIIDMADNANKMGTSIDMIQNAYQGFAKQNYTMLDNLKLGYGGTQQEMYRLLEDAAKLNDEFAKTADFSLDSKGHLEANFSDIVEAIHIVQTEMGISGISIEEYNELVASGMMTQEEAFKLLGTTAKEASTTIEGSVSSARAAWENLVVGIADGNSELDKLITIFIDSVGTAATNIIPVVERIAKNIVKVVQDNGPEFVKTAWGVVQNLVDGIVEKTPELIPAATGAVTEFIETITSPESLSEIFDMGLDLLMSLADGIIDSIPVIIDSAPVVVQNLVDATIRNAPKLLKSGLELVLKLTEGVLSNLPKLVDSGLDIVSAIIEGIVMLFGDLIMTGKDIVDEVKSGFWQKVDEAKTWGRDLIDNFIGGIKEKWTSLKNTVASVAQTVKDYIGFSEPKEGPLSNFHTYAPDMMELFAKGIRDNEGMLRSQIAKSFDFSISSISVDTFPSVNYNKSTTKSSRMGAVDGAVNSPMTIIVQSVLDGKIIGETAYQYSKNKQRAYGV